jgi:hypothetical protein
MNKIKSLYNIKQHLTSAFISIQFYPFQRLGQIFFFAFGRIEGNLNCIWDFLTFKDLWTPTAIAKVNEEKSKNVDSLIQKFQHTSSNEESLNSEEKSSEPSLPPKYSKWPDQKATLPFDDSDWPSAIDCTRCLINYCYFLNHLTLFQLDCVTWYTVAVIKVIPA